MPQSWTKNPAYRVDAFERPSGKIHLSIKQFFASIRPKNVQKEISKLTTIPMNEDECPICIEPVSKATSLKTPKKTHSPIKVPCCRGIFGSSCLWQWINTDQNGKCPKCRGSLYDVLEFFDCEDYSDFNLWRNDETFWDMGELNWRADANKWFPIPRARLAHEIDMVNWFLAPGQELDNEEVEYMLERAVIIVGLLGPEILLEFLPVAEEELQVITGKRVVESAEEKYGEMTNCGCGEVLKHFNDLTRELVAPVGSENPGGLKYWTIEELQYHMSRGSEFPIELRRWKAEIISL